MKSEESLPTGRRAIVLLSGGLDSATSLYIAKERGFDCLCLIFDYGQLHRREIESAKRIAERAECKYKLIKIKLPWKGSALLDKKIKVPEVKSHKLEVKSAIPNTYVPARNIIFLSFALSCAEAVKARRIFIGAHSQDYSGYPDCRPQFYRAFKEVIFHGTKSGVEKEEIRIETPLINKTKASIIRLGKSLGVPFELTWSCYHGRAKPCGVCDSCHYRKKGFKEAGLSDPLLK